jgi:hypothetical protein
MKRKGYAIVKLTITRTIDFELDDEKEMDFDEQDELIKKILEEEYGKLDADNDDEFDILEFDYST